MNRFSEFRIDFDIIDESLLLTHPRCGWVLYVSTDRAGTSALDSLMKHAQDHVCGRGDTGS